MNSHHRIAVLFVLIALLPALVPAQTAPPARQAKPPAARGPAARGPAASTTGPMNARNLCAIGAKNLFKDPVSHGVPRWQAEEAACYGDRVLAADVRNVHFIVYGTKASEEIRNTVQVYFTAGEGTIVAADDIKAIALPVIRAVFLAAGAEAPADLLRDVGAGVQGRMGTASMPVETASGFGYYKITVFFPGRTIE